MANKQIYELPAAATTVDSDQFAADSASNITQKHTGTVIKTWIQTTLGVLSDMISITFDTNPTPPAHGEGIVYWDNAAGTLAVMTDITDVIIQVGEEEHVKVYNDSGGQIDNGEVVYITGVDVGTNLPTIALAQANATATSLAVGVATADIANGAEGRVTSFGIVRDMPTIGLVTGPIYLSASIAGALTNTEPSPPNSSIRIGTATIINATTGQIHVNIDRVSNPPQTITFSLGLFGVSDMLMTGELREVSAGETGDYATDFAVSNNHAYIYVNSLTGSGDVTITGTSLSESTAVPVAADTETITVDTASEYYQSSKKWLEITNIDIPVGISAINYDVGVVGYTDINNQNFELLAYRLDAVSRGVNSRLRMRLIKINDDGSKKMSILDIEDIEVNAGAVEQVTDYVRTGGDDRSYTPAVGSLWPNGATWVFKQGDLSTYWSGGENIFESGTKDEGLIIAFEDINNVDHVALQLRFRPV